MKQVVLQAGESRGPAGHPARVKASSEDCDERFCGPPPHVHHETADMFFVLEGELTMRLGEETLTLGPGSFVLVPPETVHTFWNPSDRPVRFLSLMSPGGFEQYFCDLRDAFGDGPPDFARIGEIAAHYDVETVAH